MKNLFPSKALGLCALALTLVMSSCSKKEYAFFSTSRGGATAVAKANTPATQPAEAAATAQAQPVAPAATVETFAATSAPATEDVKAVASSQAAKAAIAEVKKMSFMEKVALAKKVKKEVKRVAEGKESTAAKGGKSQLVALLLCIFLGGLSIHRFYLGYITQAILQIVLNILCVGYVWVLIDLIRIITGDLEPKNGPYTDTF